MLDDELESLKLTSALGLLLPSPTGSELKSGYIEWSGEVGREESEGKGDSLEAFLPQLPPLRPESALDRQIG